MALPTWTPPSNRAAGYVVTNTNWNAQVQDNLDYLKQVMSAAAAMELTIATGAVTIGQSYHKIDTENNDASDDLDSVAGGAEGIVIILRAEDTARTVVIKNNPTGGAGYFDCGADITLDDAVKHAMFIYGNDTYWHLIGIYGLDDFLDDTAVDGETGKGLTSNWGFDHIADLDAHTKNLMEQMLVNGYIQPVPVRSFANTAQTANRLLGTLWVVPRTVTVDRLAIHVGTGDAGLGAYLGIYNVDSDLVPSTLLIDGGEISVNDTGVIAATISQQLTKGVYLLAQLHEGTPSVWEGLAAWSPLGFNPTRFDRLLTSYFANGVTYEALPNPFPAATITHLVSMVLPRIASLD